MKPSGVSDGGVGGQAGKDSPGAFGLGFFWFRGLRVSGFRSLRVLGFRGLRFRFGDWPHPWMIWVVVKIRVPCWVP